MDRLCLDEIRVFETTAVPRSIAYSVFSLLMSSPHEINPRVKINEIEPLQLPFNYDLEKVMHDFCIHEDDILKRQFSALFEIGDHGPPIPIREDLFLNQPAKLKEDLVRFYEHFGYELNEEFQWQMDHLSIELEFMYFLTMGEFKEKEDKLSYQLAQLDFSKKHLMNWVPRLGDRISALSKDEIYAKISIELNTFLEHDLNFQEQTIKAIDTSGG
jgi:DMSO reductase family type II enzyme chaperone